MCVASKSIEVMSSGYDLEVVKNMVTGSLVQELTSGCTAGYPDFNVGVSKGDWWIYSLTAKNLGPDTAMNILLEDTLPA
jgi:hypothetical protein